VEVGVANKLFGRRGGSSKKSFEEQVADMETERAAPAPVIPPVRQVPVQVAPSARLDARSLMDPVPTLPTEPAELTFTGRHLFTVLVAYEVDPYELQQTHGEFHLDGRRALDVTRPTCFWCGDAWSLRSGQRPCTGRER
jgi:hypothetical protein